MPGPRMISGTRMLVVAVLARPAACDAPLAVVGRRVAGLAEQLAAQGMRVSNAYAPAPVCSP
ncbi:MAG: hypothetical protein ACKOWG_20840, partial [Planctomycetia bacterium]